MAVRLRLETYKVGCMYKIIDGKLISKIILDECKNKVNVLNVTGKNRILADIIIGEDPASQVYINSKMKKFHDIGMKLKKFALPIDSTEEDLIFLIDKLNDDIDINGIFLEMPLPKHFNSKKIIDYINPKKDVDGVTSTNAGYLISGKKCFAPCTAEGIIELIKRSNIDVTGKNCVVIGRSIVVGLPVSIMMTKLNATVTICHSYTNDLKNICKNADILIVASGKMKSIDETYVKDGAIVIDVGIHRYNENGENKICGDVDFDKVKEHTSYITPVPGGVGAMTTAILIKHLVDTIDYG